METEVETKGEKRLKLLKMCDYKLRFKVRYARVKVFLPGSSDKVNETSGLLEEMQLAGARTTAVHKDDENTSSKSKAF